MATNAQPAATGTTDTKQLDAQLRRFYVGWRERNGAAVRDLFSDADDLSLWGASRQERVVGRADADRHFDAWLDTCPPWESLEPASRVLRVNGDTAWSADEVVGGWRDGDDPYETRFRISTVWERINDEWRLSHCHIAIPSG